ncbi:putative HTH-type DNA-binding domain-containing acetyltransferase YbfA [Colletotrichum chlorophyti]|uniref:Putative HTH-type DNA-binding domain-containing acetyltransferase YbfA n=1 Tax=Colletotrichum chlorophyti TaxID=708187 RepID=A0A1Q8S4L3_9PEZI|nr:putative HTH-type DNA-binding domain-containing acetyltransferase YbfA [Colletotrichum chlorophyti]
MKPPADIASKSIKIRTHRPGDMGYITYRHGEIYSQEQGYGLLFEAMVARITADFLFNYDPTAERCWIAEREEKFLGCIMLVKDRDTAGSAKLRCFLVEEAARGSGLGTELVRLCVAFAREVGYERIGLKTDKFLGSARRLYTKAGFVLVNAEDHEDWGEKRTGETWELKLR